MANRSTFEDLVPGDVLVHRTNPKDVILVLRVGARLDLLNLVDGRRLDSWVAASAPIPYPYDIVHGENGSDLFCPW